MKINFVMNALKLNKKHKLSINLDIIKFKIALTQNRNKN